jgi:hypothetical protein
MVLVFTAFTLYCKYKFELFLRCYNQTKAILIYTVLFSSKIKGRGRSEAYERLTEFYY